MSTIKVDVEVERKQLMTKRPPRVDTTQVGSKKSEFQLQLINRFETLHELDNIDNVSEIVTHMIQQSKSGVAKAINKPLKPRISSPIRAMLRCSVSLLPCIPNLTNSI